MNNKTNFHYGEGGRLKKAAAVELIESAYRHDCKDGAILLPYFSKVQMAHLCVLYRAGLIPSSDAKTLSSALISLDKLSIHDFNIDPRHGDIYNNYDVLLRDIVGESASWLHAARPRREAVNMAFLLAVRDEILTLIDALISLVKTEINFVRRHGNTLMADYTYLRHAQPTTLGHYTMTFVMVMTRDLDRLMEFYTRLDYSWGESGSVNGTRHNLDRERFAKLLGFSKVAQHTRDAMWQSDLPLECISKLTSVLCNLSRQAEELHIWSTSEFGYIELPDEYCRASVIMPQKKNPYPLTYIRGFTDYISPKMAAYASHGRIASGHPDSRIFIYGDLVRSLKKSTRAIELFRAVMDTLKVNIMKFKYTLDNSDAFSTDLADILVLTNKINYRQAHDIVGRLNNFLFQENLIMRNTRVDHLEPIFLEIVGKRMESIENNDLVDIFSAEKIIDTRKGIGGASKKSLRTLLQDVEDAIKIQSEKVIALRDHLNISYDELIKETKKI